MKRPSGQTLLHRVRDAIRRRVQTSTRRWRVMLATRHVHGPRTLTLSDGQCAVITMVKDAAYFIDDFICHHQKMGVAHIVIVDNGSTDSTLELAAKYDNVTICRNRLPAKIYETYLRSVIARRCVRGGWFLFLDSDELFALPTAREDALSACINHCNQNGFTAVAVQYLDLFSAQTIRQTARLTYAESRRVFNLFSLGKIRKVRLDEYRGENDYFTQQIDCSAAPIYLHFGGIRKEIFDENCLLTAIRLVKNLDDIGLYVHPHFSTGVRLADFTGLLKHYKFTGDIVLRDHQQIAHKVWEHGEDIKRAEKFAGNPDFTIRAEDQQVLHTPLQLVTDGFLLASDRFQRAMRDQATERVSDKNTS